MTWLDVTLPVRDGMTVWPGDPATRVETVCTVEDHGVRLSRLTMGSHVGTHIDAPSHFIEAGQGVDGLAPAHLIGPCTVLDLREVREAIRPADLRAHVPGPGERLLLRTSNGERLRRGVFAPDYPALDVDAARYLVEAGVVLVGIDALSIERFDAPGHPVHVTLLAAGVVIVEGVDLLDVAPGRYEVIALPLRLEGLDGSPARVLLRKQQAA